MLVPVNLLIACEGHPHITNHENLNARNLIRAHLNGHKIDVVVSDVSFVSLKIALPPALDLAEADALAVLLIKPQFEVGKDNIGKGGIVRPEVDLEALVKDMMVCLKRKKGWRAIGTMPSPAKEGMATKNFAGGAQR